MIFLLNNWKAIFGGIVALIVAYNVHTFVLNARISAVRSEMAAACKQSQQIARSVSDDYQDQIADLNRALRDAKRVRVCVPIDNTTGRRDGPTGKAEHVGQNGVDTETLYDFAGDAEKYRLQLIACQAFVKKITQ